MRAVIIAARLFIRVFSCGRAILFGLLLILKLLKLAPLLLDLLLLRLDLLLGLLIGGLIVLHFVANRIAGNAAECATDRRPRCRCSHRGTNDRSANRAFLTRRERLPPASGEKEKRYQSKSRHRDGIALHGLSFIYYVLRPIRMQPYGRLWSTRCA